ncbi:MAG: DUF2322 family protein [Acidovorax sp.]|jgi:hypothetical protein|nr:DUF2322 family protein [Acidovorax sp.]
MAFADNLRLLPAITETAALHLLDENGSVVAEIPNAPGKTGSLTIYHALALKHGRIDAAAAEEGLQLFAEHTEDAKARPGAHPNIDRLLEVIATGKGYGVQIVPA